MKPYTLIIPIADLPSGTLKQLEPEHPDLKKALDAGHRLLKADLLTHAGRAYWVVLLTKPQS